MPCKNDQADAQEEPRRSLDLVLSSFIEDIKSSAQSENVLFFMGSGILSVLPADHTSQGMVHAFMNNIKQQNPEEWEQCWISSDRYGKYTFMYGIEKETDDDWGCFRQGDDLPIFQSREGWKRFEHLLLDGVDKDHKNNSIIQFHDDMEWNGNANLSVGLSSGKCIPGVKGSRLPPVGVNYFSYEFGGNRDEIGSWILMESPGFYRIFRLPWMFSYMEVRPGKDGILELFYQPSARNVPALINHINHIMDEMEDGKVFYWAAIAELMDEAGKDDLSLGNFGYSAYRLFNKEHTEGDIQAVLSAETSRILESIGGEDRIAKRKDEIMREVLLAAGTYYIFDEVEESDFS